jgi:hypothetical protein
MFFFFYLSVFPNFKPQKGQQQRTHIIATTPHHDNSNWSTWGHEDEGGPPMP